MSTIRQNFIAMTLLVFAATAAMLPVPALAQIPAPALTTTIVPPPANQPFAAAFHYYAHPTAFGFNGFGGPNIAISGNTITLLFDGGCGFICPGGPVYATFPFTMPALQSGRYRVRIVTGITSPTELAAFDLDVGATATAVPAGSGSAMALLIALLALLGALHQELRNRHSRHFAQSRLP